MAKVTLTRMLTRSKREEVVNHHNGQAAVRSGKHEEVSTYDGFFNSWAEKHFDGVRIAEMSRCTDRALPQYGFLEIRLDPEHESFAEIAEWVAEDDTWVLLKDGVLRCNAIKRNPTDPSREEYEARAENITYGIEPHEEGSLYYSTFAYKPDAEVQLDRTEDAHTVIRGHLLPSLRNPDEMFKPGISGEPSVEVTVPWHDGSLFFGASGSYYRGRIQYPPEGYDLWEYIDNRDRKEGFNVASRMRGIVGTGSEAKACRAAGVPADGEMVRAVRNERMDKVLHTGKRMIDVGGDTLDKTSVGTFPLHVLGPNLADWRYEDVPGAWRRSKEYVRRETGCTPLVFGLSRSHDYFRSVNRDAARDAWPQLQTIGDEIANFFVVPADMLLVTRTPFGWHGLFVLRGTMRGRGAPEVELAYLVPTFLAIDEAKNLKAPALFRRLDAETKQAIDQSFGLADFLQQALYVLQGAKAKMQRKGYSLDNLPPRKFALPDGHLLRSWGADRTTSKYEVEDEPRGYRSPRKWRVGRTVARIIGTFHEQGNVPFGHVTMQAPANDMEELQPVATKRVLEL